MTQNTMAKLSSFRQIIDDCVHFKLDRTSSGEHVLVGDNGVGLSFSESELNSFDARLTPACTAIESHVRRAEAVKSIFSNKGFDAELLKLTVEHWLEPKSVTLATGAKLPCSDYGSLTSINKGLTTWDVRMNPTVLALSPLESSRHPETYVVSGTMSLLCCVHPKWLDSVAPDWENRFAIANSLGMEGRELSNYVFAAPRQNLVTPAHNSTLDMEV